MRHQEQLPLLKPVRATPKVGKHPLADRYDFDNAEAARIILADPEKHGAGLAAWANLYLVRKARDLPNDRH